MVLMSTKSSGDKRRRYFASIEEVLGESLAPTP